MAETKTTKTTNKEELVDCYIEKVIGKEDPNYYVKINRRRWVLPKGKTSKVPAYVKAEIDRSRIAQEKLEATHAKLIEKGKTPIFVR